MHKELELIRNKYSRTTFYLHTLQDITIKVTKAQDLNNDYIKKDFNSSLK